MPEESLAVPKTPNEEGLSSNGEKAEVPPEWKEIIQEAFNKSEHRALLDSEDVKNSLGSSYPTNQTVICDRYSCYYEDKHFELGFDYFNFKKKYSPGRDGSFSVRFGKEHREKHLPVYNVIVKKCINLIRTDI
ncbi:hypothetical protein X975_16951, partial [Stegodyphus mimosarum]